LTRHARECGSKQPAIPCAGTVQSKIGGTSMMKSMKLWGALFLVFFSGVAAAIAGQSTPLSPASQPPNLFKEVLDHKGQIQWKPAPAPGIPADVCRLFMVCEDKGAPKMVSLPRHRSRPAGWKRHIAKWDERSEESRGCNSRTPDGVGVIFFPPCARWKPSKSRVLAAGKYHVAPHRNFACAACIRER
jgi:hypothetical protein